MSSVRPRLKTITTQTEHKKLRSVYNKEYRGHQRALMKTLRELAKHNPEVYNSIITHETPSKTKQTPGRRRHDPEYNIRQFPLTDSEEQWLTGFTEGDGSISLQSRKYPKIFYGQKERHPLDHIQSLLDAGKIHEYNTKYTLAYCKRNLTTLLLSVFAKHIVSEHYCANLNITLKVLNLPPATQHEPTLDWLIGFWDAEGSSGTQPSINASQKEKDVIDKIKATFGGSIDIQSNGVYRWRLTGSRARTLAETIATKSHNPSRTERLINNFTGPIHEAHREKYRVLSRKRWEERKRVKTYIKEHPEITKQPVKKPT